MAVNFLVQSEDPLAEGPRLGLLHGLPVNLHAGNYADKKGYSGTAILTRTEPLSVTYGFGDK
mgnify:CR=1 FL=1